MKLDKNRHVVIAKYLIENTAASTSDDLAALCSVSSRTIKSDIGIINDVLKENGAEIVSKKSEGYLLQISDKEIFDKFRRNIYFISYYYSDNVEVSMNMRLLYLLRTILSAKGYIKLDDIADELYISRSAMKKEIELAETFISGYGLSLISKAGYGLICQGKEEMLRLCMLACFGITYHDYEKEIQVLEFSRYFNCLDDEYQACRRIFLGLLRELGYRIRDDSTQRLARYFVLMKNRMNDGKYIALTEDKIAFIKKYKQYKYAEIILNEIDSFFENKPNESEVAFLAIQLLCYQDYLVDEINEDNLIDFYNDILDLNAKLIDFLRTRWGLFLDEEGYKSLIPTTSEYIIKNHFGLLPHYSIGIGANFDIAKCQPLALAMAQSIINFYENRLGCIGVDKHVLQTAYVILNQLRKLSFPYRKRRLLTCNGMGRNVANNLVGIVNSTFDPYIESNLACELYEIRGMDQAQYDCVIIDNPLFTYNYEIPPFRANRITIHNQLNEFYQQVIIKGFQYSEAANALSKLIKVYDDFKVDDMDNMNRLIAFKHSKSDNYTNRIYELLNRNDQRLMQLKNSSFVLLEVSYTMTNKNAFEIYRLSSPINSGENKRIEHIIYVSIDFIDRNDILLALHHVMNEIYLDNRIIDSLINSNDKYKEMCDVIEKALSNSSHFTKLSELK